MDKNKQRMQIIADNITYYRKKKGITQKELADAIGVAPGTITDYMKLRSAPSFGIIQKMADYFEVEKSDIDSTFKDQNIIHGDNNGLNSYNNSSVTINHGTSKENFDRSHDQQVADFELQKEILSYLEQQTNILNQLLSNTEKILDKLNKGEENGIIWKNKK